MSNTINIIFADQKSEKNKFIKELYLKKGLTILENLKIKML